MYKLCKEHNSPLTWIILYTIMDSSLCQPRQRFSAVEECIVFCSHYQPSNSWLCLLQHIPSALGLSSLIDRPLSGRELHIPVIWPAGAVGMGTQSNKHWANETSELDRQLEELPPPCSSQGGYSTLQIRPVLTIVTHLWWEKDVAPQWDIDSASLLIKTMSTKDI